MNSDLLRTMVSAAAIGGLMLGFGTASADTFTSVASQGNGGYERCLTGSGSASITAGSGDSCSTGTKSNYYNGALSIAQLVADDLSATHGGSAVTLTRLDDGNPNKSLFTYMAGPPSTQVEAIARYAGNGNTFGIIPGTSGGSYTNLLGALANNKVLVQSNTTFGDANSHGDIVTNASIGTIALPALADGSYFRPAIQGPGGSYTFSSLISDNPNLLDHLVAYKITGLDPDQEANGIFSYLLGFEDGYGSTTTLGDADYEDYVIELDFSAVRVPEPGTLALIGGGLAMFGFVRRRRQAA